MPLPSYCASGQTVGRQGNAAACAQMIERRFGSSPSAVDLEQTEATVDASRTGFGRSEKQQLEPPIHTSVFLTLMPSPAIGDACQKRRPEIFAGGTGEGDGKVQAYHCCRRAQPRRGSKAAPRRGRVRASDRAASYGALLCLGAAWLIRIRRFGRCARATGCCPETDARSSVKLRGTVLRTRDGEPVQVSGVDFHSQQAEIQK